MTTFEIPTVSTERLRLRAFRASDLDAYATMQAKPVVVKMPKAENPGLVAAIERWIAVAGTAKGEALFRSIKRGGDVRHIRGRISPDGVNVVLKSRFARYLQDSGYTPEDAAKEAKRYSGHSGRVGMYTAASEAGIACLRELLYGGALGTPHVCRAKDATSF